VSSNIWFVSQLRTVITSESAFQQLVHGTEGEPGSVIGCLTALAAAAGNEQLWKPLNHAVLEACGNETRAEVRKGGICCLLSLINALGEEYMVLLPECLPVLSELLEDSDEEIAGLAQECVSIGEELLGESLQESLR
jgi:U3 small nucleolar RNA-associated protein 10